LGVVERVEEESSIFAAGALALYDQQPALARRYTPLRGPLWKPLAVHPPILSLSIELNRHLTGDVEERNLQLYPLSKLLLCLEETPTQ
jgi:hypothetical protein